MPWNRNCDFCGQYSFQKLTSVYWRWYPYDQASVGYLVKYCDGCFIGHVAPGTVFGPTAIDSSTQCVRCGIKMEDDPSLTWATIFARQAERIDGTNVVCDTCAIAFRADVKHFGKKLEDRPRARDEEPNLIWLQLGIEPRVP